MIFVYLSLYYDLYILITYLNSLRFSAFASDNFLKETKRPSKAIRNLKYESAGTVLMPYSY
jgi:hypothetical protein